MALKNVAVIGGIRTPFVRSQTQYMGVTTQELMTATLNALVEKYGLHGKLMGEVILGGVMVSSRDWNLARECVLGTPLDPNTPAMNLQRACGTSIEAANLIALKIEAGQIKAGIAGGVDTNSDVPILVSKAMRDRLLALNNAKTLAERLAIIASFRPSDLKPQFPAVVEPRTGMSMGQHCELMVKEWKVTREEQDALALASHQGVAKAQAAGFFDDQMFEFHGVKKDSFPRADTSMEKLAKLKPAFDRSGAGTITAGNASPLTDGSSAALLASLDEAKKQGWPVLARFVDSESAAVDFVHGAGLLMAPTLAVSRMLERNGLTLQDFDIYEIHEAFAGQVLCTLKAWEDPDYCKKVLGRSAPMGKIDRSKLNPLGSSVAIGHPFGATGTRILSTLAKELKNRGGGRGLISVCTAGGMGVAAIIEA